MLWGAQEDKLSVVPINFEIVHIHATLDISNTCCYALDALNTVDLTCSFKGNIQFLVICMHHVWYAMVVTDVPQGSSVQGKQNGAKYTPLEDALFEQSWF